MDLSDEEDWWLDDEGSLDGERSPGDEGERDGDLLPGDKETRLRFIHAEKVFRDEGLDPRRRKWTEDDYAIRVASPRTGQEYTYFPATDRWKPSGSSAIFRAESPEEFAMRFVGSVSSVEYVVGGDTWSVRTVAKKHDLWWDPDREVWWTADREAWDRAVEEMDAEKESDTTARVPY